LFRLLRLRLSSAAQDVPAARSRSDPRRRLAEWKTDENPAF